MVFVAILAARLRTAAGHIAELRAQRDRDIAALAKARADALEHAATAGELERVRTALADAQAALVTLRADRDAAAKEAAEAQLQRHAFLAGVAHDLRNPLAPLSNGIELLRLTDNDPAGRLRTRGIMERQVVNLMRMADELSELARLSGAQASLQHAPFELAPQLEALAARLRPSLQAQEMTLELGAELAGLPRLQGDAQRLGEAFAHLVDDVQRHAGRGSTIRITATADAGRVTLRVAAAEDLQAGDEPARPLEAVDVPALGLGIALAARLVALHGGQLRAERPAGTRRVRFTATLPAGGAEPAAAAPAPAAASADGERVLSVLLADDNVDFSHSFGTMLELLGHRVEVVHDGLAAVNAIVGSPPDIAFVDIGMPALDGVEAVRRVRGQGNTHDVLLVAVTGHGGAEDRARAAEAGFDRYLVKPFAMQDVRDALDAAVALRDGSSRHPPGAFAP